jgi:hypothetical protein
MITTVLEVLLAIVISGSILKPFLDDYPFREWEKISKHKDDKEQRKFKTSAFVAFAGISCAVLSFVISQQNNASLNKELVQLQEVNNMQLSQIDALRDANLELSEELRIKSTEIIDNVTGGDSYCYLQIHFLQKNHTIYVDLLHKGEYPLYDVQVQIEDLGTRALLLNAIQLNPEIEQERAEYEEYLKDFIKKTTVFVNVGNVAADSEVLLDEITLPETVNHISWQVRILAKNGEFFQRIEIMDIWEKSQSYAMQVVKDGKILLERIPDDFPEDKLTRFF